MHAMLIAVKKPGQLIPDGFIEEALRNYPTTFGIAIPDVTKGKPDLAVIALSKPTTLKVVQDTQASWKDRAFVMGFGYGTNGFTPESLQPFTFLRDTSSERKPTVVGFLDGEFNVGFRIPGADQSRHSAAFFVTQKYLIDKIGRINEEAKGDLNKMFKLLGDKFTQREILLAVAPSKCTLTLISAQGHVATIAHPDEHHREYPWAWVNAHMDYEDIPLQVPAQAENESIVPRARPAWMDKKKAVATAPASPPPPPPPPAPPEVPEKKAEPEVPEKKIEAEPTREIVVQPGNINITIPIGLKGRALKRFLTNRLGYPPQNVDALEPGKTYNFPTKAHHHQAKAKEQTTKVVKDLKDLGKNLPPPDTGTPVENRPPAGPAPAPAEAAPKTASGGIKPKWFGSKKEAVAEMAAKAPKQVPGNLRLVPVDERDKIISHLGMGTRPAKSLAQRVQEIEDKTPPFTTQMGKDLEETFQWELEEAIAFNRKFPDAFALLWMETRNELMRATNTLDTVTAPAPKAEETAPASTDKRPLWMRKVPTSRRAAM